MTNAPISLRKGGLPRREVCRKGGHDLCNHLLEKGRPAMKGRLPSASKEVGITMVSFLPDSVETGLESHGLNPSLL